jgi:hypothetical protein
MTSVSSGLNRAAVGRSLTVLTGAASSIPSIIEAVFAERPNLLFVWPSDYASQTEAGRTKWFEERKQKAERGVQ